MTALDFATVEHNYNAMRREVDASPDIIVHDVFGITVLTYETADRAAGELAGDFAHAFNAWHGTDRVSSRLIGTMTEMFLAGD